MTIATGTGAVIFSYPLSHLKSVKNVRSARLALIAVQIALLKIVRLSLVLAVLYVVRNALIVHSVINVQIKYLTEKMAALASVLLVLVVLRVARDAGTQTENYIAKTGAHVAAKTKKRTLPVRIVRHLIALKVRGLVQAAPSVVKNAPSVLSVLRFALVAVPGIVLTAPAVLIAVRVVEG
jgi:hypothetical protein